MASETYTCDQCGQSFNSTADLTDHVQTYHTSVTVETTYGPGEEKPE